MVLKTKVIITERAGSEPLEKTGEAHQERLNEFTRTLNPERMKKISTTPLLESYSRFVIVTHITYLGEN